MSDLPSSPEQLAAQHADEGYRFHNPEFVAWWLRSLYLLPPHLQLEAADAVRSSVHLPTVHAQVDHFTVDLLQQLEGPHVEPAARPADEGASSADLDGRQAGPGSVSTALQRMWRKAPVLTVAGVIGLVVLVTRGAQVVLRWIA